MIQLFQCCSLVSPHTANSSSKLLITTKNLRTNITKFFKNSSHPVHNCLIILMFFENNIQEYQEGMKWIIYICYWSIKNCTTCSSGGEESKPDYKQVEEKVQEDEQKSRKKWEIKRNLRQKTTLFPYFIIPKLTHEYRKTQWATRHCLLNGLHLACLVI